MVILIVGILSKVEYNRECELVIWNWKFEILVPEPSYARKGLMSHRGTDVRGINVRGTDVTPPYG